MLQADIDRVSKLKLELKKQGVNIGKLPAAIYARKSTEDISKMAIDLQIKECTKYASNCEDITIVGCYSEERTSGVFTDNRKKFKSLLKLVESGEIKVVISYSTDRISRNVSDTEEIDKIFKKNNAILMYAVQQYEDNAQGRLTKRLISALNQYEPENTSEKSIKSGFSNAIKCDFTGGKVPYGYKIVENKYVVDENEVPAVKMMFQEISSGASIKEVISKLTSCGYLTRKTRKPFSYNSVYGILKNEKYKGIYLYNKKDGRKRKFRVSQDNYDEIRIENGIPQIIDEETFSKVQVALTLRKRKSSLSKEEYLLTGYLVDGKTGIKMHGEVSYGGSSHKRYTRYCAKRDMGSGIQIRQEYIEKATAKVMMSVLNKICSNSNSLEQAFNQLTKDVIAEQGTIANKIRNVDATISQYILALANAKDEVTRDIISTKIVDERNILRGLKAQKECLKSDRTLIHSFISSVKTGNITITSDDLLKDHKSYNRLLALLIKEIRIDDENVVFVLNDIKD